MSMRWMRGLALGWVFGLALGTSAGAGGTDATASAHRFSGHGHHAGGDQPSAARPRGRPAGTPHAERRASPVSRYVRRLREQRCSAAVNLIFSRDTA